MVNLRSDQALSFAPVLLEGCRARPSNCRFFVHLGADHGVGADHDALAALDAHIGIPDGHFLADVALFVLGGAMGEGAVRGHGADGQVIPLAGHDFAQHIPHEGGRIVGHPLVGGARSPTAGPTGISNRFSRVLSTAFMFMATTSSPFLP
jgi:hypothetical protein